MGAYDPVAAALEVARTGSLRGRDPGRTDTLEISVPGESFVIPADVVSALGEGNTENGFHVLEQMFPPSGAALATGGSVPIIGAAGEFVVGPEHVSRIGGGNMKKGHSALRDFVQRTRKKHIKTLKALPGPARG